MGPPLIGQTLPFIRDPFHFLSDRQQRHGNVFESTLERLGRRQEFSAITELRKLAMAVLCRNVMGLPEGPETESISRDYGLVLTGITATPIPFPGTPYGRARGARDRLLARIRKVIAERRARPGDDAISRILAARATDGSVISDAEAVAALTS
jgi:cytochrome P450